MSVDSINVIGMSLLSELDTAAVKAIQHDGVTVVNSMELLSQYQETVQGVDVVGFDGEGVDLSRVGTLTLVSVGIKVQGGVHVFLFDFLLANMSVRASCISALKTLLENPLVVKIVHDCRQDSDALSTQHTITLTNVFDSSVYSMKIGRTEKRINLNQALKDNGCALNSNRDAISGMYKVDPNIWQKRPLTPFMIEYASKDVASLFDLRDKLLASVSRVMPEKKNEIQLLSEQAASEFRSLQFSEIVAVPKNKMGCVIGRGGSGIASIERQSGGFVSCPKGAGFLVLAETQAKLNKVKQLINASYY